MKAWRAIWKCPFLALLLASCLASCDFWYGMRRHADVPGSFDPIAAEELLRQQDGFDSMDAYAWDGKHFWCRFRCEDAIADFEYSVHEQYPDCGLSVYSLWLGHVPDTALLQRSMALQERLLRVLRQQIPDFPLASTFTTEWINMEAPPDLRFNGASTGICQR